MKKYKRHLVTSALPYANGPIHIGHLAGVYVPSDIYTRYLRMRGEDVISICGSDEHGVPITLKARKEGITPQEVVDRYHELNKKAFADFGIAFDIYSRTSNKIHYETASQFFRKLYDKGEFVEKTTSQYYDEEAGCFLADRYITGTCPHCGNEEAFGDQCEKCGTSLSPTDLINPKSTISGSAPVMRDTLHWYLPLDKHEPWIRKWILEEHTEWKPNVYGQCKSWLDQGLQPRAVSRDLDWGVPVPLGNAKGKVLYVWFDAPIGYISATRELTPDWEKYWKDPETRMVHFIGKDNIVFHCIIFPAMLKAEGSYILPDNVPANEFLNLENDKISTSKNWAVWLHEYLEDFPGKQDSLRYALCASAPETKDNDFTWKEFQARNNNELVAILGNFVNRTLVLTANYYNGTVPVPGVMNDYDRETVKSIMTCRENTESNLEAFRFRQALAEAMNLARLGNKYLADTEPWKVIKTDPERVKTIMYISLQITANLAILLEPFLPFSMEKLREWLGTTGLQWDAAGRSDLLSPGHGISSGELLFSKIDDAEIEKQIQKLLDTKKANHNAKAPVIPQKEDVTFDEFTRMDIRTATILEADKVPKTTKLI
ncbi:MAG: methionine--tRNA ligase, partial [Bacteroidales bacterium]